MEAYTGVSMTLFSFYFKTLRNTASAKQNWKPCIDNLVLVKCTVESLWTLSAISQFDRCLPLRPHSNYILNMAALHSRRSQYILQLWLLSSFFFFFLAYSQRLQSGCLQYFHTWCGLSANLECRPEMCCTWLAEYTGCKKVAICAPSHNFVRLYLRN